MTDFADSRLQIAEILQIADSRLNAMSHVCQMPPAKFLPNATCHLLKASKGGAE